MTKTNSILFFISILAVAFVLQLFENKERYAYVKAEAKSIHTPAGWGYEVWVDNKVFIHQEAMPGYEGKKGFTKETQALRIANLIIQKMKNHQSPTVSNEEVSAVVKDSR